MDLLGNCLKKLGRKWGGASQPPAFMTDHDHGEINGILASCSNPKPEILLCSFHIAKAVFRNLSEGAHNLTPAQKTKYYDQFKECHTEPDTRRFRAKWDEFRENIRRDGNVSLAQYFQKVYCGEEDRWAFCFRDWRWRNNDTNNVSERAVQTIKAEVLKRIRSFNAVELLDIFAVKIDKVYSGRLLRFAYGRDQKRRKLIDNLWANADKLVKAGAVSGTFANPFVKSSTTANLRYKVDTNNGKCECFYGRRGAHCSHMGAVAAKFNQLFPGILNQDPGRRFQLACLATGPSVTHQPGDFNTLRPASTPTGAILASEDAPVIWDGHDYATDDADLEITGFDLGGGGGGGGGAAPVPAITLTEERVLDDKSDQIANLHRLLSKKAAVTHGMAAVISAMDTQIAALSKAGTGASYMLHLNMQTSSILSNRKKSIGVNNSAIMRRKSTSKSRKPLKPGASKRSHKGPINAGGGSRKRTHSSSPGPSSGRSSSHSSSKRSRKSSTSTG